MHLLQNRAGAEDLIPTRRAPPVSHLDWEDIDDEDEEGNTETQEPTEIPPPTVPPPISDTPVIGPPTIESKGLPLPSYHAAQDIYREAEIKARIQQANRHLSALRELIVTKAFQYADVLRQAPRKSVRTRSRKAVYDISQTIMYHTQVYSECRLRLQNLQADPEIFNHLQVLTKDDIHTSTAVIDPNSASSRKMKLSWIWYSVTRRLDPFLQDTPTGRRATEIRSETNSIETQGVSPEQRMTEPSPEHTTTPGANIHPEQRMTEPSPEHTTTPGANVHPEQRMTEQFPEETITEAYRSSNTLTTTEASTEDTAAESAAMTECKTNSAPKAVRNTEYWFRQTCSLAPRSGTIF